MIRLKNIILTLGIAFGCCVPRAYAVFSPNEYAVENIAPSLLKDANLVKRNDDYIITIKNNSKATFVHRYAFTVFNEEGARMTDLSVWYDRSRTIDHINGGMYDAAGNKIKTLAASDLTDNAMAAEALFASDVRMKLHRFYSRTYPYTVAYEVSMTYRTLMFLPQWLPQSAENTSVQHSSLQVTCPADYQLRHRDFNYNGVPAATTDGGSKTLTWKVDALPALIEETQSPGLDQTTPSVYLAPTSFTLADYEGNMSSWQGFGAFIAQLNKGLTELPAATKKTVHALTDPLSETRQKIEVLYRYLQANTHYVNVVFGIGGLQPHSAAMVAGNQYGDCKALSNFMCALLHEANIPAYYCLIKAGEGENAFINDFPFSQFNHAIVCVPLSKDTVWLECTSQTLTPGYLSQFTSGRPALLINGPESKLVYTPNYSVDQNTLNRQIIGRFQDGSLHLDIRADYRAILQDHLHEVTNEINLEKEQAWLTNAYNFPENKIISYKYLSGGTNTLPAIREELQVNLSSITTEGRRIFLPVDLFTLQRSKPLRAATRKADIMVHSGYTAVDSFTLELPEAFKIETMPAPVSVKSKFGRFASTSRQDGRKWIYYTFYSVNEGRYPATDYLTYIDFKEQVFKATTQKLVLVASE